VTPAAIAGAPPLVVAAASSLVIAAVAALWLGLTMLVALNAFGGGAGSGRLGFDGVFLVANGLADLYLAYQLIRGSDAARWVVSGMCGCWVIYWLYEVSRTNHAFRQLSATPFGSTGFRDIALMATFGVLLLAGWAGTTVGLLWMTSTVRHFGKNG
jgi:hypothetical protein